MVSVETLSPAPGNSPLAIKQEVTPQTYNGSRNYSREILFNNLSPLNFPLFALDAGKYVLDRIAAGLETVRLENDETYRGNEKVSGDGSPIAILPGSGTYIWEYTGPIKFFTRAGYTPKAQFPGVSNVGQIDQLLGQSKEMIKEMSEKYNDKIHLIGHSLGGYIIRVIAQKEPDLLVGSVADIFILGAPIGGEVNRLVETAFIVNHMPFELRQVDEFVEKLGNLPEMIDIQGVRVYEIESENDLIVKNGNGKQRDEIVRFASTHRALLRDPDVLRYIIERLG